VGLSHARVIFDRPTHKWVRNPLEASDSKCKNKALPALDLINFAILSENAAPNRPLSFRQLHRSEASPSSIQNPVEKDGHDNQNQRHLNYQTGNDCNGERLLHSGALSDS
jgi:hypothetical protein